MAARTIRFRLFLPPRRPRHLRRRLRRAGGEHRADASVPMPRRSSSPRHRRPPPRPSPSPSPTTKAPRHDPGRARRRSSPSRPPPPRRCSPSARALACRRQGRGPRQLPRGGRRRAGGRDVRGRRRRADRRARRGPRRVRRLRADPGRRGRAAPQRRHPGARELSDHDRRWRARRASAQIGTAVGPRRRRRRRSPTRSPAQIDELTIHRRHGRGGAAGVLRDRRHRRDLHPAGGLDLRRDVRARRRGAHPGRRELLDLAREARRGRPGGDPARRRRVRRRRRQAVGASAPAGAG